MARGAGIKILLTNGYGVSETNMRLAGTHVKADSPGKVNLKLIP